MLAHVWPDNGSGHVRTDTFSYTVVGGQNGYLEQMRADVTGPALVTLWEYDARGNITRHVEPVGNDTLYVYNALDQVVWRRSAELT